MCEYCNKRADNKKQINIDNEYEEFYRVFLPPKQQPLLCVQLNAEDEDGYTATGYFKINYCPMCRQKVGGINGQEHIYKN